MSDPLALIPMAMAAGGGRIGSAGTESFEVQQLVAAGVTLLQRSAPLVRALTSKRSAILLPTSPAYVTALAASEGRGAVLINPLAAPVEIAFQCADANVGAIFTSSVFVGRIPAGIPYVLLDDAPKSARVVSDERSHDVDLGSHHGLVIEGERGVAGSAEDAVVVYTSAMQGTSLGARLSHGNILSNARSTNEALENTSNEHVLALLPYAHLFGLTVTAVAPMLIGARVTAIERFNPAKLLDVIGTGVTQLVGVPAVFHALLAVFERRGIRLTDTSLRLTICGGAVLPRDLQNRWYDVTGMELRQGYGLTEAGPVCLVNRPADPVARGTMGRGLPNMEVAVHSPADYSHGYGVAPNSTAPVPRGMAGEICIRGDIVFQGYIGDRPGLPVRDGWLYSGDAGVADERGNITFLGLLKPMFTRNGFNVYPHEVERVVGELPGVTRVEVSGVAEPGKEHAVHARIWGSVTAEAVKSWCEARLSAYKQPTVVEIVSPVS